MTIIHSYIATSDRQIDQLVYELYNLSDKEIALVEAAEPVTAPGIPPDYPQPANLVTDDCIRP